MLTSRREEIWPDGDRDSERLEREVADEEGGIEDGVLWEAGSRLGVAILS
jgi:hypothetical protein